MLSILLTTLLGFATTTAEIESVVSDFNQHAVLKIPVLEQKQAQDLMDGKVVRILFQAEDPDDPSAAVAFALSSVSRDAMWIAAQDPHTKVDPDLTEQIVRSLGDDHAIWYGYWDLPRPVRDRQWVVESGNNHALAAAMGDKGWEHSWVLVEDGLKEARPFVARGEVGDVSLDLLDNAIFTPVNRGAWFMFQLDDGKTLYGYQATSVVGGAIPTWLVTKLVMARLESILRDLETRAREWSPKHYDDKHSPVFGGDGKPIPRMVDHNVP